MNSPTIALGARLTAVKLKDQSGEETGKVVEWLMDVEQGRVIYVVAQFNETDEYHAIPWGVMKADLEAGGYLVDPKKVKDHNLQIDRNLLSDLVGDKNFLNRVFDAYQLPKYWEESQSAPSSQASEANPDQEAESQNNKPVMLQMLERVKEKVMGGNQS
jgi:hypothetical protein